MSKFRIKMKLTGLELEIEGTREEMPQIAQNLGRQFSGLIQPAAGIVQGELLPSDRRITPSVPVVAPTTDNGSSSGRKRGSRKRKSASGAAAAAAGTDSGAAPADLIVELTHDATKFGMPKQEWSTAQKAIWLIYVVGEQTDRRELTAHQIEATFNRYFREARQILVQNIARDLGKQRARTKDAPVAEDNTMDPSPWYLTEAGRREAQELVNLGLTRTAGQADVVSGDSTFGSEEG